MTNATTWACGVFEGGGAKGAAYAPTLQAVDDAGIRFCSVAGSSAGALTAVLVAAGCAPTDIRRVTLEALDKLAPPRFGWFGIALMAARGLRLEPPHVRSINAVRDVVERELRAQLSWPDHRPGPVTFGDLQSRPEPIELFVVAIDAVGKREHVFHHALHPEQGVANAAVASAAIPLYFPPGQSLSPTKPWEDILFDGGVWANFPTWIYKDSSFRSYHGLPFVSQHQDGSRDHPLILGFLLDEERAAALPSAGSGSQVPRTTWGGRVMRKVSQATVFSVLAFTSPLYLFGLAFLLFAATVTLGCELRGGNSCAVREHLHASFAHFWIFWPSVTWIALAGTTVGFVYQVVFGAHARSGAFIADSYRWAERLGSISGILLIVLADRIQRGHISAPAAPQKLPRVYDIVAWSYSDGVAIIALSIAGVVTIIAFAAIALLAPAVQGVGSKIMFILTSAGSARYWAGADEHSDHVVKIPVKGIDTLSFKAARAFVDSHATAVTDAVTPDIRAILERLPVRRDATSATSDRAISSREVTLPRERTSGADTPP